MPILSLFFSPSICHEVMEPDAMILVFECWVSSQFFHSPLSPSSRGSLVPLHFVPLGWSDRLYFLGLPKLLQLMTAAMKLKDACSLEEKLWQTWTVYWKAEASLCQQRSAVKAVVFPVVMYGYESWTVKKAERQRIDVFELWCRRGLFRVSWTAGRANQSILKLISPKYSLEGLMLKLKLQYFGHLMWRANLLEKTLMLGKIEGRRRRGQQTMRWLDGITIQWMWVWTNSRR